MSTLKRLFVSLNKRAKALEEDFVLENFIQPHAFNINIEKEPFDYVVIDNFFKESFAAQLTAEYNTLFARGLSRDPKEHSRFHFFEEKINYDGYVYTPAPTLMLPFGLFFSLKWNMFFSKLFNKPTTFGTNFSLHHHPVGDRSGWVHSDYATYIFPHTFILPNGVNTSSGADNGGRLSPAEKLVRNFKQKRSIALLYYFNNPPWSEGDGGETGLYSSKHEKDLHTKVAPINNRLLVFDITPSSFHAFQHNNLPRNSFVQWFHTDLDWSEKKYGFL